MWNPFRKTPNEEIPVVDVSSPEPRRGLFGRTLKEKAPPRPLLLRLFGIGLWGALKLAFWCVLVGFFVLAANFDPRDTDVNVFSAVSDIARQAFEATGWAVQNFWQPAAVGATIVLPIWVIWRLLTLPFRS